MNNKISIIIPFFNTKREYLFMCVKSALSQTYKNIEVIVINDGSNNEYTFLEEMSKNKEIILINKENGGVSSARNKGISISTGNYILFVDSDDWLEEDACEKFNKLISDSNDPDVIISNSYINNNEIKSMAFKSNEKLKEIINKRELIECIFNNGIYKCVDTPWAKIYKNSFLKEQNISFDEKLKYGEDGLFNYNVYTKAKKVFITNSITYNYRINQFSVCNTFYSDMEERYILLIREYEKIMNKNDELLIDFKVRIFCRLLRKFYSKTKNYKEFKMKINKFLKTPEFNVLYKIKFRKDYNKGRNTILYFINKHMYIFLYFISKSKKICIK